MTLANGWTSNNDNFNIKIYVLLNYISSIAYLNFIDKFNDITAF